MAAGPPTKASARAPIPSVKLGRRLLVPCAALDQLLAVGCAQPSAAQVQGPPTALWGQPARRNGGRGTTAMVLETPTAAPPLRRADHFPHRGLPGWTVESRIARLRLDPAAVVTILLAGYEAERERRLVPPILEAGR